MHETGPFMSEKRSDLKKKRERERKTVYGPIRERERQKN